MSDTIVVADSSKKFREMLFQGLEQDLPEDVEEAKVVEPAKELRVVKKPEIETLPEKAVELAEPEIEESVFEEPSIKVEETQRHYPGGLYIEEFHPNFEDVAPRKLLEQNIPRTYQSLNARIAQSDVYRRFRTAVGTQQYVIRGNAFTEIVMCRYQNLKMFNLGSDLYNPVALKDLEYLKKEGVMDDWTYKTIKSSLEFLKNQNVLRSPVFRGQKERREEMLEQPVIGLRQKPPPFMPISESTRKKIYNRLRNVQERFIEEGKSKEEAKNLSLNELSSAERTIFEDHLTEFRTWAGGLPFEYPAALYPSEEAPSILDIIENYEKHVPYLENIRQMTREQEMPHGITYKPAGGVWNASYGVFFADPRIDVPYKFVHSIRTDMRWTNNESRLRDLIGQYYDKIDDGEFDGVIAYEPKIRRVVNGFSSFLKRGGFFGGKDKMGRSIRNLADIELAVLRDDYPGMKKLTNQFSKFLKENSSAKKDWRDLQDFSEAEKLTDASPLSKGADSNTVPEDITLERLANQTRKTRTKKPRKKSLSIRHKIVFGGISDDAVFSDREGSMFNNVGGLMSANESFYRTVLQNQMMHLNKIALEPYLKTISHLRKAVRYMG